MSKQIISSQKKMNSYQITNASHQYSLNPEKGRNNVNESIAQKRITIENRKTNSIQQANNANNFRESNNQVNLDSESLQQKSINSQKICICGKWQKDTNKTYVTTENCTCDDGRDLSSMGCNYYKSNTNKTYNKTLNKNNQKIYIQEGSNSEYCNHDMKEEHQVFSNPNSEYNLNVQNLITDEDINLCTCGLENTIQSSETNEIKQNKKIGNSNTITQTKRSQRQEYKTQFNNKKNNLQYSTNINISSTNELPIQTTIQTTDSEDKEINNVNINEKNIVNKEINIVRKKIREEIKKEIVKEDNMETLWSGENYIQIIERIQFLASEAPPLRVQFLNDMMINRTINNEPINILIPIPENYIQKQGVFEVLSDYKKEEEVPKDLNEDLCPENVDLLNISNAYSIPVPSFNNLEIENEEMFIEGIPKIEEEKKVEPYIIENYSWNINPSERKWGGKMRMIRINKLGIDSYKQNWNDLVEEELASKFDL